MTRPTGVALLLATVFAALAWTAFDFWRAGSGAIFNPYGLTGLAWYLIGALGLAWLMVATSRPAPAYTPVATRIVLSGLGATLVLAGIDQAFGGVAWKYASYGLIAVAGYGLARYLIFATGRRQILASMLGAAGALVFWWLSSSFYLGAELWYQPENPAHESSAEESESLLFSQPEKIDAAVAAMQSDAGQKPQAWFIGFAGYGEQRVFAQEIDLASKVIGQRYHAGTRSMRLVNDQRDMASYPLGTFNGLSRSIRAVAGKMNKERDVLFLSLSSHGSEFELAVSNGGLPLMTLTSARLGELLRESGIRWKVIVISACYAGSFIDDLKGDSTIIITAASADRTSFGCSDDRDLTYFGEAFYRDALPKAKNLREAFELASASIAAREEAEDITPSMPQAVFGPALEKQLGYFE